MIDNETFLKTVFGPAYQRAHVTAFTEDPATLDTDGKRHLWAGGPWSRYRSHLNGKTNNYFAISLFKGRKRRKQDFDATYCIVVDDVREKVPEDKLAPLPPPSWRLETSPGSEQWGYLLFYPETDRGRVEALLNGLVAAGITEDGKDPGMKGVTRYVRLPQGVNTKAKHHKDGRPWQHRLLEWAPDRAYTLEDLAAPFGIDLDQQAEELHDYIDRANDPALDALNEIGLLKHHLGKGRWEITCPWQHEHSDRADTGAAYLTLDDGSRVFKCHHGHCEARTWQDLQDYLSDNTEGLEAALASELGFEALPDDGSADDFGPKPARRLAFERFDAIHGDLKRKALVKGVLGFGAVSVVYGNSNVGKSFFVLDLAMAVARGLPWRTHRTEQRPVVYFAAEAGGSFRYRVHAYRAHHQLDGQAVPFYLVPAPITLLPGGGRRADTKAMLTLMEEVADDAGQPPGLVVIDTLARALAGGNENASEDMGAFVGEVDRLRDASGAHVLIVHHTGKDLAKGARGHSSLRAAVDTEIEIDETKVARITKQRDYPGGQRYGFDLSVVDLGKDADGDPVTSCIVIELDPDEAGRITFEEAVKRSSGEKLKRRRTALEALRLTVEKDMHKTLQDPFVEVLLEDWKQRYFDALEAAGGNREESLKAWGQEFKRQVASIEKQGWIYPTSGASESVHLHFK